MVSGVAGIDGPNSAMINAWLFIADEPVPA
jgi:hypothetical protein